MLEAAGITRQRGRFEFVRKKGLPFWTLSYQIRGENEKTIGSQTVTRRAPYFALTRPNTAYRVRSTAKQTGYLEYWVIFAPKPDWMRLLDWPEEQAGACHLPLPARAAVALRREFDSLLGFTRGVHPEKAELAENALERILLLLQELHVARKGRIADERIARAISLLNTEYAQPLSLEAVAAHVSLSVSRLAHLFSEAVGSAPMHYLETRRIEAAKSLLLSTNEPVKSIAHSVGFSNCYHFSTRFRRVVGVSPRGFRERTAPTP